MADILTLIGWQEDVGERMFSAPGVMHNEGKRRSYTYNRMTAYAGDRYEKFFRHGNRLKERLLFKPQTRQRRIDPLDENATYPRTSPGKTISAPWSVAYTPIVFNDFEKDLGAYNMRPEALAHIFKDRWDSRWEDFWTGHFDSLEEECWAVPDKSLMEVTDGFTKVPLSFHVFINEYLNGLPAAADQPGGTWTTRLQLDPTDVDTIVNGRSRYVPQQYGYDLSSLTDAPTAKHKGSLFFSTMGKLERACRFDKLPMGKGRGMSDKASDQADVYACSNYGLALIEHLLRVSEDHFRGTGFERRGTDPNYPHPLFNGVPFDYFDALDTTAAYPTGLAEILGTEKSDANVTNALTFVDSDGVTQNNGFKGPRYFRMNLQHLCWMWHRHYYHKEYPWQVDRANPWEASKVVLNMNQLWCTSVARQGMMIPIANADDA